MGGGSKGGDSRPRIRLKDVVFFSEKEYIHGAKEIEPAK